MPASMHAQEPQGPHMDRPLLPGKNCAKEPRWLRCATASRRCSWDVRMSSPTACSIRILEASYRSGLKIRIWG